MVKEKVNIPQYYTLAYYSDLSAAGNVRSNTLYRDTESLLKSLKRRAINRGDLINDENPLGKDGKRYVFVATIVEPKAALVRCSTNPNESGYHAVRLCGRDSFVTGSYPTSVKVEDLYNSLKGKRGKSKVKIGGRDVNPKEAIDNLVRRLSAESEKMGMEKADLLSSLIVNGGSS